MPKEDRVGQHEQRFDVLLGHPGEGAFEGTRFAHLHVVERHPHRLCYLLERLPRLALDGPQGRHCEHAYARRLGHHFFQQFQPFEDQVRVLFREPREVPARPREARDEPQSHRIANARHNDGQLRGRVLGSPGGQRIAHHDDIDLQPDELGRQVGEAVGFPLGIALCNRDVLAFHPSQLTQPLPERLTEIRVT
jgi:hypothetical protein